MSRTVAATPLVDGPAQGPQVAPLQPPQVFHRVVQAVDVIDPQAVHVAADQQVEHKLVASVEDLGILHADGRQVVDVEEAAIVDLVGGRLPVREPIDLGVEQLVEAVEAVRVAGRAVELPDVRLDESAHRRATRRSVAAAGP